MKSILYGLLLALVPDLSFLQAGLKRLSTCSLDGCPLKFEIESRTGSLLVCSLHRCSSTYQGETTIRVLIDVCGHVIRPLELHDHLGMKVAGDRSNSLDVDVELQLCSFFLTWLIGAKDQGHRLDASANLTAEV